MGNTPLEKYFAKIARKKEEKKENRRSTRRDIILIVITVTLTKLFDLAIIYIQ